MSLDKKSFWSTTFTLSGTIIGAGILGLPYVFAQSGFFIGLFWILFLGLIMVFVHLAMGEITLRTKTFHQIPGYAGKYIGKKGKFLMLVSMLFGIYSALLAYLIGEGQSLSRIFIGDTTMAIYFGIGFWLFMTLFLREGLRGLKRLEYWGVLFIIVIILFIFSQYFPQVNAENLTYIDFTNFLFPFGVVLFALLGFTSIPELRVEIKGHEKYLKKAIIFGTLIPIILYILFGFIFLGVLGKSVGEVATLSFGNVVNILGILTMMTSYFVLSFSLKDIFDYDLKHSKLESFFFVSILPLIFYLGVSFFGFANFVTVLGIGGVVSGGFTGTLIMLVNMKAKKKGNRKTEFSVPMNWIIFGIVGLIFLAGILFQIF